MEYDFPMSVKSTLLCLEDRKLHSAVLGRSSILLLRVLMPNPKNPRRLQ